MEGTKDYGATRKIWFWILALPSLTMYKLLNLYEVDKFEYNFCVGLL